VEFGEPSIPEKEMMSFLAAFYHRGLSRFAFTDY
jgi:hypothetical protein